MENTSSKRLVELLAPARDYETGRLAILAGADAVYIGAARFGARAAAGNSWEDIAALCSFAHLYRAKVYLALNTIIFEAELESARETAWQAYEAGIDALIIQDMGLLEMDLPPIPVFASTQTDNRDLEQVKFLEQTGFSRVIFARELSLEQIRAIREKTQVDLECFVHGALCVSYSGRCYLSQATTGRSANRGSCTQACRLPYSLVDSQGRVLAKDKYLLSLRDLNLSSHLEELIDAGVSSFKIEGRLKDGAYVTNVVAYYRRLLDDIIGSRDDLDRPSLGVSETSIEPDPAKSFNRGFSEYFFSGQRDTWISPDSQKSLGERIGRVADIWGDSFSLEGEHDLHSGQGICFLAKDGRLHGALVNMVDKQGRISLHRRLPLSPGDVIYRNENPDFEQAIISNLSRKIPVKISVSEVGDKLVLLAVDSEGISSRLETINNFTQAQKPDVAKDNFRKQLAKAGDTPFSVDEVSLDLDNLPFVAISEINAWRRELLSSLERKRLESYTRQVREGGFPCIDYFSGTIGYEYNVANSLARRFYLDRGATQVEEAIEVSQEYRGKRLMTTKHCLRHYLGACPKEKAGKGADLAEPLYLVSGNKKLRLSFDCQACNMQIYEQD